MLFFDDGERISSTCQNYYVRISAVGYVVEGEDNPPKPLIYFAELKHPSATVTEVICWTSLHPSVMEKALDSIRAMLTEYADDAKVDKRKLYPAIRAIIRRLKQLE